ncbi:hypothetical protein LTR05_008058 [Lithohypha guttulata]|uniref:Uncharacterized protein n=1 Tax=Lithohypha guttulata TaxID=1690604 RepID=A0AAN7STQ6_9EURO|nr:hypothetical protein LTR05_008058 [Lithohypha guttulata]
MAFNMPSTGFVDSEDKLSLPEEMWLYRRNDEKSISEAIKVVNKYIPIPSFTIPPVGASTTTVISAFFPPPADRPLLRAHGQEKIPRSVDDYRDGIRKMVAACQHLILFLPPDDFAEEVRALSGNNVVIYDHYTTPWDLPHLKQKKESFHRTQTELDQSIRTTYHGEPHSWGCWNAKTYFVLEAMKRDPFRTSNFVWLDARTPLKGLRAFPGDIGISSGTWPHPEAVASMYRAMKYTDRGVVCCSYDTGLTSASAQAAPSFADGASNVVLDNEGGLDGMISICANLMFGDKRSLARLARAHLIVFERDFEMGSYVAREEFQLSYAHYEFQALYQTLELFRRRPLERPMKTSILAYMLLSRADSDWSGLGLDKDPEF